MSKILKTLLLAIRNIVSHFGYKSLICGIGNSDILKDSIRFDDYPFKPSIAAKKEIIRATEIEYVYLSTSPLSIKVSDDLIFISKEYEKDLQAFAERHSIEMIERNSNWNYITEPFLDTEFDQENQERTVSLLAKRGIDDKELLAIREQISKPMFRYNSVLWEWVNLGLSDVLSAMRKKLNSKDFEIFYWKAIELDLRKEA